MYICKCRKSHEILAIAWTSKSFLVNRTRPRISCTRRIRLNFEEIITYVYIYKTTKFEWNTLLFIMGTRNSKRCVSCVYLGRFCQCTSFRFREYIVPPLAAKHFNTQWFPIHCMNTCKNICICSASKRPTLSHNMHPISQQRVVVCCIHVWRTSWKYMHIYICVYRCIFKTGMKESSPRGICTVLCSVVILV